jgi:thiamine biosynthesis lipoprotein
MEPVILVATALMVWLAAEPVAASPQLIVRGRYLMGSACEIRAFGADPDRTGAAIEAALDRIGALEDVMTTWRPDGELARLNAACASGSTGVAVSADLARALAGAREWAVRTEGVFVPTIGALVSAWGLREGGRVPADDELARAVARTSWELFDIDVAASSVSCSAGVELDLGGYGKGLALDEAAAVLRGAGIESALLNFGGQVLALGAPPGEPGWIVELAHPVTRDRAVAELVLHDASLSTSSNAERGFTIGRKHFGHALDPRTGRPAPWRAAVSVLAETAAAADALSTALLVVGPDRAEALLPPGAEFVALEARGERPARVTRGSPSLTARLARIETD